jgi:hypothetical protein
MLPHRSYGSTGDALSPLALGGPKRLEMLKAV